MSGDVIRWLLLAFCVIFTVAYVVGSSFEWVERRVHDYRRLQRDAAEYRAIQAAHNNVLDLFTKARRDVVDRAKRS